MTEAPDEYPDLPDDDEEPGTDDGVEGMAHVPDDEDDVVRTGDDRVDAVLDSLADLGERPVAEHAAVFERAHEQLRAALDPGRESA
jgi:hypothetical protein